MLLRQLRAKAEASVENQYRRVVPWEGNRAALQAMAEVFELRPYLRMARPGLHFAIGAADQDQLTREWDAERAIRRARRARHRSESGAVRRGAEGRAEAGAVQAVRQRVHAGASGRRADGVVRRLVRGVSTTTSIASRRVWHRRLSMATADGNGGDADRQHAPRYGHACASTIRRSRWRTAPAAKPAAAWSKAVRTAAAGRAREAARRRRAARRCGGTARHHHR